MIIEDKRYSEQKVHFCSLREGECFIVGKELFVKIEEITVLKKPDRCIRDYDDYDDHDYMQVNAYCLNNDFVDHVFVEHLTEVIPVKTTLFILENGRDNGN